MQQRAELIVGLACAVVLLWGVCLLPLPIPSRPDVLPFSLTRPTLLGRLLKAAKTPVRPCTCHG